MITGQRRKRVPGREHNPHVRALRKHTVSCRAANAPLQSAEPHEDLITLVFHLPVNAHDLHTLHQGLQSLSVVFHTGTGAARADRGLRVTGRLGPLLLGTEAASTSCSGEDPILSGTMATNMSHPKL